MTTTKTAEANGSDVQITGVVAPKVAAQLRAHMLISGSNMSTMVRTAVTAWVEDHPVDRDELLRAVGLEEDAR